MSARLEIGHADPAHLPLRLPGIGVVAHLGRQVEGDRQAGLALLEQVPEAPVRLLGGREAGVLAHRPEAAAVHRRLDAPGERVLAGPPEVPVLVEAGEVGRGVQVPGLDAGRGLEPLTPLRRGSERLCPERSPATGPGPGRRPHRSAGSGRRRRVAHPRTTRMSPGSTVAPGPTATRSTVPSRGDRSSFCIFIASTVSSCWPARDHVARGHRDRQDSPRDDGTNLGRAVLGLRALRRSSPEPAGPLDRRPPPRIRTASRPRRPRLGRARPG